MTKTREGAKQWSFNESLKLTLKGQIRLKKMVAKHASAKVLHSAWIHLAFFEFNVMREIICLGTVFAMKNEEKSRLTIAYLNNSRIAKPPHAGDPRRSIYQLRTLCLLPYLARILSLRILNDSIVNREFMRSFSCLFFPYRPRISAHSIVSSICTWREPRAVFIDPTLSLF